MQQRIINRVENDPHYHQYLQSFEPSHDSSSAAAIIIGPPVALSPSLTPSSLSLLRRGAYDRIGLHGLIRSDPRCYSFVRIGP